MSKIKIFSLGGLNENGKNMYIVEVDDNIFVFDAGLKYPTTGMLGVNYIIPKFDYLINNKKRIKGIFISRGHDGNYGALVDILKELPDVNVYATKFTMNLIKEELQKAQIILSDKMSAICELLDFEEEFKPGKILFDLEKFSLKYSIKDKENILLSEMGSGSNWLAIHLSTFLGFLYLHSITSTSKIPSILILDQPSQVYFPKVYKQLDEEVENEQTKVDDNIIQVKNIFKVISDEIANIDVECGYKPQVIVLEHADEDEFAQFIKYRWSKDGNKLI